VYIRGYPLALALDRIAAVIPPLETFATDRQSLLHEQYVVDREMTIRPNEANAVTVHDCGLSSTFVCAVDKKSWWCCSCCCCCCYCCCCGQVQCHLYQCDHTPFHRFVALLQSGDWQKNSGSHSADRARCSSQRLHVWIGATGSKHSVAVASPLPPPLHVAFAVNHTKYRSLCSVCSQQLSLLDDPNVMETPLTKLEINERTKRESRKWWL
jgi:hypothetical protein